MARFVAIPPVNTEGLPEGQALALGAIKENVEILAGIRGAGTANARAIRKDEIRVNSLNPTTTTPIGQKQMTVKGESFEIRNRLVPSMSDFVRLINDVVECKRDITAINQELTELRQSLSTLIEQLKNT